MGRFTDQATLVEEKPRFGGTPVPVQPVEQPPAPPTGISPTPFAVAGGLAGGAAGVPFMGVFPPAPLITGALGAGFATEGVKLFNELVLGVPDPRSGVERAIESSQNLAVDIGMSSAIPGLGRLAKKGLGAVINPPARTFSGQGAAANLADFQAAGVPPSAGGVTGNRFIQGTEQALSRLPTSARTMQVRAAAQQQALGDELERIVSGVGKARTPFTAGRQIIRGVDSFAGRVRGKGRQLFNAIPMLKETPVRMDQTAAFIREDLEAFANDPELRSMVVSPKLEGILAAIQRHDGELTWGAVKRLRSAIGDQISDPRLISDASTGELKRLYGAISQDMGSAAEQTSQRAFRSWQLANRFWRTAQDRIDLLEPIIRSDVAERAFAAAVSGSRDGPTLLRALRGSIPKDQWGDFSAALLHRMGQANPGAQDALGEVFSPRTYLTNWNRLSSESKDVLFGRGSILRMELDRLSRITASLRAVESMANPSGTAGQNVFMGLLQGQFGAVPGFAAGGTTGAVIGATGALGLPMGTAKLMTQPWFLRWLSKGVRIGVRDFNSMATHLARLGAIKSREPEHAAAIDEIIDALAVSIGVGESAPL